MRCMMPLEVVRCISTLYPNREAREEAVQVPAGAVVGADYVSADVDRDNGRTALPSTLGPRRSDRGAAHRVSTCEGTEADQRRQHRSSVALRTVRHGGAVVCLAGIEL